MFWGRKLCGWVLMSLLRTVALLNSLLEFRPSELIVPSSYSALKQAASCKMLWCFISSSSSAQRSLFMLNLTLLCTLASSILWDSEGFLISMKLASSLFVVVGEIKMTFSLISVSGWVYLIWDSSNCSSLIGSTSFREFFAGVIFSFIYSDVI